MEKSGRWYGVYRADVLKADGTFEREQCWQSLGLASEQSERAAWKQFQPYLDRVNDAAKKLPPRTGLTLAKFVEEWRRDVAVNLKGSTTRAAESHLRAHINPKLGSLPLTEITTKAVQGFVAYLASGGRSRKTVENVLLTLSSLFKTARAWNYACGNFRFADLTLPSEGVKVEPRCFTDDEVRSIITHAAEPLSTIVAVTAVLGLRIGGTLALRTFDVDFAKHVIRIRQSLDGATRIPGAVKSKASCADLPMPTQLQTRLRSYLEGHDGKNNLLFVNRRGRAFSANKLREKQLHPLLVTLDIPRGGFHSMRHGAASALLADGATPAVVQRQLRHISGSTDRRPELDRLLVDARRRRVDVILVWKLDRFSRSLRNLVNSLAELDTLGVDFVSLRDNLDFSTPSGRLMFQIIGAMAEFERALIQERVRAGMRNARAKGRRIGRPSQTQLSSELRADIANAYEFGGTSLRLLAKKFGTSLATVQRCVRVSRMRNGDGISGPVPHEPPTR